LYFLNQCLQNQLVLETCSNTWTFPLFHTCKQTRIILWLPNKPEVMRFRMDLRQATETHMSQMMMPKGWQSLHWFEAVSTECRDGSSPDGCPVPTRTSAPSPNSAFCSSFTSTCRRARRMDGWNNSFTSCCMFSSSSDGHDLSLKSLDSDRVASKTWDLN
jgi:hypothetical protein